MATRKLVEISPQNYRRLQAIRRDATKDKRPIPSMPFLVNQGLEEALPGLEKYYSLYSPAYATKDKISSR